MRRSTPKTQDVPVHEERQSWALAYRWRFLIGFLLVAAVILIGVMLGARDTSLTQSRLESAVASGATSFDFAAEPTPAWDRMYVFGCYSNRASVENALGFSWPEFGRTSIEWSDSVVLVVFVQNGKVASWYEQPRTIELGYLANDNGYSRSEAEFRIDRTNGIVDLKPQSAATAPAIPK